MPAGWKRWKANGTLPTVPTPPWESRKGSEIPTFPQRRRLLDSRSGRTQSKRTGARWKTGNPKTGFPLSHRTDSGTRKEHDCYEV